MSDRYIYLVFSKTRTVLSRILSFVSHTEYVHASIGFDPRLNTMYSFGRLHPDNPFVGGFVVESLYGGVYRKFFDSECLIYRVGITETQYNSLQDQISLFLEKKEKYKYNFLGLFFIPLKIMFKRRYYYYCSQFVCEVLIKSGIFITSKPPELIRTSDLLSIENKELVYQGYVRQYCQFDPMLSN